jgi:hypothetical protein
MKKSPKRRHFTIERQIKGLRTRVGALERALRNARQARHSVPALTHQPDDSVAEAKRKALAEYYKQREVQIYLRNPSYLQAAIESENDRNAFLKSRGFKPEPSRIPEQFRRGLKKYRPTVKSTG